MSATDVLVIGSGAGGSPVVERLCRAGAQVTLLERGKAYTRKDFDRDEIEWCRRDRFIPSANTDPHTRRTDEGQRAIPTTDGWISTVLGGGTVHMGGYMMRGSPDDLAQGTRMKAELGASAIDWPLSWDELAPWYDAAERGMGVSGVKSTRMPPLKDHALAKKVEASARALGMSCDPTPRGILTEPRLATSRNACVYNELCASYGCTSDAKGSMPVNYLRKAKMTGKLTVRTEVRALRLLGDGGRCTGVEVLNERGEREQIAAKRVIVACGAIESARLLLLSGAAFNPGGQVGKNLWFSLFVEATGFFPVEKHKDVDKLMAGSPFLNRTVRMGGKLSEAEAQAAGVDRAGTIQVNFVHDNPIHRAERVATEGGIVFGSELKKQLKREFTGGRRVILEGFGESVAHPGAYVDLDPKVKDAAGQRVARITHFHHTRDAKVARQLAKDMTALLEKMGADEVRVLRKMSETTVLQGGTCRMGSDPKTSVTGKDGRVHGFSNLWVTDGGALPSSLAVPTTLTIVANASRIAEGIAKG